MGLSNGKLKKEAQSFFRGTPFSVDLDDPQLKEVVGKFKLKKFGKGTEICKSGDPCLEIYVVKTGIVEEQGVDDASVIPRKYERNDLINFGVETIAKTLCAVNDVEVYTANREKLNKWVNLKGPKDFSTSLSPNIHESIKDVPFFNLDSLSPEELNSLTNLFHLESRRSGEIVYSEGDKTENENDAKMYIITSGQFSESKDDANKNQLSKNAIFGELALVQSAPRSKMVTCSRPGSMLSITKGAFFNFLDVNGKFKDFYIEESKKVLGESLKQSKMSLFDGLQDDQYVNLVKKCTWESHKIGDTIFKSGEEGDTFYIVLFGNLDVIVGEKTVNTITPGSYFGEIALVTAKARTATIVSKTECVLLSMTKDSFEQIFSNNPEFLAQFQVKLAPEMVTFKHILYHTIGMECFYEQMEAEHSTENISFWKEVRAFIDCSNETRIEKAKEICKLYIAKSGEMFVNLNGVTRKEILDRYEASDFSNDMFNKAQNEIFSLMQRDSFSRFKSGPHFAAFLAKVGGYSQVDDLDQTRVTMVDKGNSGKQNQSSEATTKSDAATAEVKEREEEAAAAAVDAVSQDKEEETSVVENINEEETPVSKKSTIDDQKKETETEIDPVSEDNQVEMASVVEHKKEEENAIVVENQKEEHIIEPVSVVANDNEEESSTEPAASVDAEDNKEEMSLKEVPVSVECTNEDNLKETAVPAVAKENEEVVLTKEPDVSVVVVEDDTKEVSKQPMSGVEDDLKGVSPGLVSEDKKEEAPAVVVADGVVDKNQEEKVVAEDNNKQEDDEVATATEDKSKEKKDETDAIAPEMIEDSSPELKIEQKTNENDNETVNVEESQPKEVQELTNTESKEEQENENITEDVQKLAESVQSLIDQNDLEN